MATGQPVPSGDNKPDFEVAVKRFQEFLAENCDYSAKIVWLTYEDVIVTAKGYVYVRIPVPAGNENTARQAYEEGMKNGLA